MAAELLIRRKARYDDGAIREVVIWRLSQPDRERPHGLKYRLYYGKDGRRLVGYDNERGKGDHRHIKDEEYPYTFVSVNKLIADFLADIEALRNDR